MSGLELVLFNVSSPGYGKQTVTQQVMTPSLVITEKVTDCSRGSWIQSHKEWYLLCVK